MKSITSKKTALIGNVLTTILVAIMGTINIINNLYSFTGYSPFVIALVGIVAMSVYPVLEWVHIVVLVKGEGNGGNYFYS